MGLDLTSLRKEQAQERLQSLGDRNIESRQGRERLWRRPCWSKAQAGSGAAGEIRLRTHIICGPPDGNAGALFASSHCGKKCSTRGSNAGGTGTLKGDDGVAGNGCGGTFVSGGAAARAANSAPISGTAGSNTPSGARAVLVRSRRAQLNGLPGTRKGIVGDVALMIPDHGSAVGTP